MKLNVETREVRGKDVKKLRREGKIPAIIYGKHMENSISIICDKNEFVKLYRKSWSSTPITLSGEWIDEMVLVHDYQLDPVSDVVLHVDFLALTKWEKVSAEVSIIMTGDELSPIVKAGDGSIQLVKDSLAIEALPKDLIKEIIVDVSNIDDVNTVLFVKDLDIPSWVEIKDDLDLSVISVFDLKKWAEVEEAAEAAAAEAGTENAAWEDASEEAWEEWVEEKSEEEKK